MGSDSEINVCIKSIVANFHVLLIMSTVLSVSIDYYNIDKTIDIEWTFPEKVIMWHSFGFFVYQILHYVIGRWLLNCCELSTYPVLSWLEALQAYVVLLYTHNILLTEQQNLAQRVFELFEYTFICQKYSVYLFVSGSMFTAINCWISSYGAKGNLHKYDKTEIFGTTYENCNNIISWISLFGSFPLLLVLLLDFFLAMYNGKNLPKETSKNGDLIVFLHFLGLLAYQFLRTFFISIRGVEFEHHVAWSRAELIQLVMCFIYIYNPFIAELQIKYTKLIDVMEYTLICNKVTVPFFLILMVFKSCVDYKISCVVDYKRKLENTGEHQKTIKIYGITYKTWVYSLFFFQIVSLIVVPVVWWFESSNFKLLRFDLNEENIMVLTNTLLLIYYQIFYAAIFACFAFSSLDYSAVVVTQVLQLALFLLYWFNPVFSSFRRMITYISTHYPYTSVAQTGSMIIFISVSIFIILLMCKIEEPNQEEIDKYEILDGENKSSTKKEHHEHPVYWLKKEKHEIAKLFKKSKNSLKKS